MVVRGIFFSKKFLKKNKKQVLVFLRSPKHFNIGKRKVFSFKNTHHSFVSLNLPIILNYFLFNSNVYYNFLINHYIFIIPFRITSLRTTTKVVIKWL